MAARNAIAKTFGALLERSGDRLGWTIIRVPLDVAKVWGVRGQLKVKGEINGFGFRTSLFPTGKGGHILIVNKKMQAGGRAVPGTTARFCLEPDTAPRRGFAAGGVAESAATVEDAREILPIIELLHPARDRKMDCRGQAERDGRGENETVFLARIQVKGRSSERSSWTGVNSR